MSKRAGPRLARTAALAVLTALAAACATSAGEGTPAGEGLVDEEAVRRLLTVADLDAAGAQTEGLEPRVEDLRALAEAVDAEQVREIRSWYGLHFERADRASGLSLTVVEFDSVAHAGRQLDTIESGPAFKAMAQPVGDRSASVGAGGGTGVALAFVSGRRLVTLHSIAATEQEGLVDAAQVEALARLVEGRL